MRLKSTHFVAALIRSQSVAGGFATVIRKGAAEAGTIFILHRRPDAAGGVATDLYGPAPQAALEDADAATRVFECLAEAAGDSALEAALARETRFDPDCWVVELEAPRLPEELVIIAPR